MKSGLALIKMHTWLFSSIWTRRPVILSSPDLSFLSEFYNDLIALIPRYRQPILVGDFPKKIQFGFSKPKIINNMPPEEIQELLLNIFEEERLLESRSLELMVWNPSLELMQQVLARLDQGWITVTTLAPEVLQSAFPGTRFERYPLTDQAEVIFVAGRPARVSIEQELMQMYFTRSRISAAFLIQKKMHEIKFIAEAIVSEIGHGKKFHQVELQELFALDQLHFEKCLQIIEAEFHLDIHRYIKRTANPVKKILRQLIEIEGVIYACAFRNGKLTGIVHTQSGIVFPLRFFKKLVRSRHQLAQHSLPEALDYLVFELNRKTKIILLPKFLHHRRTPVWFGFFINPNVLVAPFLREVNRMLGKQYLPADRPK